MRRWEYGETEKTLKLLVKATVRTDDEAKALRQKVLDLGCIPSIKRDEGIEADPITRESKFVFRGQTIMASGEFDPQDKTVQQLISLISEYEEHDIYLGEVWFWQQQPEPPPNLDS